MARKLRPREESEFSGDASSLDPLFEAELLREFTRLGDSRGEKYPSPAHDQSSPTDSPSDENPEKSK